MQRESYAAGGLCTRRPHAPGESPSVRRWASENRHKYARMGDPAINWTMVRFIPARHTLRTRE
jgi:hypothetical protein